MAEELRQGEKGVKVRLLWPRTRRDWFLALLGGVLALGIVGNLLPQGPEEVQAGPVRLRVPAGWEAREVQGGWALLSPLEGPQDTFRENLTLLREVLPQPLTPAQYAQVVAWRNAQALQGFVPHGVVPVRLGGVEAVRFAGEGAAQGRQLAFWVWAFVLGQEGYQITFTGEPGKLDRYRAQVEEALRGLEGLAQAPAATPPPGGAPMPPVGTPTPSPSLPPQDLPGGYPAPEPAFPSGSPAEGWDYGPDAWGSPPVSAPGEDGLAGSLQDQRDFNTWMAEEWSQLLSGQTPEPTHQDEAGNLYWEGPSGLLHDWGDYGGE